MSFDLPASLERDLEKYAQIEHISPAEAAIKFIQSGLKAKKQKTASKRMSEDELEQLRQDPTVAFFERLPDHALEQMQTASKQIRAERFAPRA